MYWRSHHVEFLLLKIPKLSFYNNSITRRDVVIIILQTRATVATVFGHFIVVVDVLSRK